MVRNRASSDCDRSPDGPEKFLGGNAIPFRYSEWVFTKRVRISESVRFYTHKNTGFLVRFSTIIITEPLRNGPIID